MYGGAEDGSSEKRKRRKSDTGPRKAVSHPEKIRRQGDNKKADLGKK